MRAAFYLSFALLFLACGVPSFAQSDGLGEAAAASAADLSGAAELYYDVRGPISLQCTLPKDNTNNYKWLKNGTDVDSWADLKERYRAGDGAFNLTRATEDDFGNYTCRLGDASQHWRVLARPHAKISPNSNVVEGQKLKLQCKVVGKPYPVVSWVYKNDTLNATAAEEALAPRVTLRPNEQGVENAELVLEPAGRYDAGEFTCVPGPVGTPAATTLRVKDMYAALWPFLGICAEVFVLCAIILAYEKRRTKPELDDSDTDNHDQKKS